MIEENKFICPFCSCTSTDFGRIGSDIPILQELQVIGAGKRYVGCTKCHSSDRERLVYLFLRDYECLFEHNESKVLHIAPEMNLSRNIIRNESIKYIAGDAFTQGYTFPPYVKKINILSIPFDNQTFDYIICNHVLQDVMEDIQGMKELYRVLKFGGKAIIQVPISKVLNNTIESDKNLTEEERFKRFGFKFHVRIYEHKDYIKRLNSAGFWVDVISPLDSYQIHGINKKENIYLCKKYYSNDFSKV